MKTPTSLLSALIAAVLSMNLVYNDYAVEAKPTLRCRLRSKNSTVQLRSIGGGADQAANVTDSGSLVSGGNAAGGIPKVRLQSLGDRDEDGNKPPVADNGNGLTRTNINLPTNRPASRQRLSQPRRQRKQQGEQEPRDKEREPEPRSQDRDGPGNGGGGNGGDNSGGKCKVSFYTDDPAENDGYTTTADGSPLDHTKNIVAVPTGSAWSKYRGKTVQLGGKTYTVRDSCSVCEGRGISFDILVGSKEEAHRNGIQTIDCSWDSLK